MADLPSILNFRDVGTTVNEYVGAELIATGKLYRSARPDEATNQDRLKLSRDLGIQSVIDLRTKTEHIEQARKRDKNVHRSSLALQTNDETAEPLKIPGLRYHEISLNGPSFSLSLVNKLSWWNFGQMVWLMIRGRRLEAISIIGTNVMKGRGIIGLATDSIDYCGKEIFDIFQILAEPSSYPLLIHCTQGKDRTGLSVNLCLSLLDVPMEAINYDYMLSQDGLLTERDERLKEIRSIGLDDEFANCNPELCATVQKHVQDRYGGVEEYLLGIGVTPKMQDSIRQIFLPATSHSRKP